MKLYACYEPQIARWVAELAGRRWPDLVFEVRVSDPAPEVLDSVQVQMPHPPELCGEVRAYLDGAADLAQRIGCHAKGLIKDRS